MDDGGTDGPSEGARSLKEAFEFYDYDALVQFLRTRPRLRLQPAGALDDVAFEDVEPWSASSGRGLHSKPPPTEG